MSSVGPFEVKYERGHSHEETWKSTDWFCPACGTQNVWVNDGPGDYYEGPQHLCLWCRSTFNLPRLHKADDWQDAQRFDAIASSLAV